MVVKYEILFNIIVSLEGYTDIVLNDIDVIPSADSLEFFRNQRLIYKYQNDRLVVLAEIESSGTARTITTLSEDMVIQFYLQFKNTRFQSSHSNLSAYDLENNAFVFTNKTGTVLTGNKYLSIDYTAYDASADYNAGYFVKDGSDLYVALQASTSGDPKGIGDTSYWKKITFAQYVSQNDLAPRNTVDKLPREAFGVVQIANTAPGSGFEYLDVSEIPQQTQYNISFKNSK